jgi:hypothetical protein
MAHRHRNFHRSLNRVAQLAAMLWVVMGMAMADDLHVPASVEAGQAFSIPTEGSGQATFYVIGPDHVIKRGVNLGSEIQIQAADVTAAGMYQVLVCSQACSSARFEVKAAQPAKLSFFLHPSRVPVSTPDSIDATTLVFDRYWNLVLAPAAVDFHITPAMGAGTSRKLESHNGIAWMRMDSTAHEGPVQVTAALGSAQEPRVIQQVAAEACGLRMKAVPSGKSVVLETDPVRDCSGNPLPDGTVVSFTKVDEAGKSTVDTPIKKGVARTQFDLKGPAHISVACGVVLGNEVAVNGKL